MKNSLICLLLTVTGYLTFAQTTNFEKFYGGTDSDCGYGITQSLNGDFTIVGNSYSFGTEEYNNPTYIINTDEFGNLKWDNVFGLSPNNTMGRSIVENGGNIFVSGYGDGGYGIFLMKLDQAGDSIWTQKYFDGYNTSTGVSSLIALEDGFLVSGIVWASSPSFGVIIRTNIDGDTLWTNQLPNLRISSVSINSDNTYIASTSFEDTGNYGIVKLDVNGDLLWSKSYLPDKNTRINSVKESNDGGFIISGGYYTNNWSDGFIIKTDANGNEIWTKTFDLDMSNDAINSLIAISNGYVFVNDIIVNSTNTFIRLRQIDESGTVQWKRDFDCLNSQAQAITMNKDAGFSIIGSIRKSPVSDFADIFHIKTDSLGQVLYYSDTIKICEGESIEIGSEPRAETGFYYDTLSTIYSCDSIIYKYLKVNSLPEVSLDLSFTSVCNDDPILEFSGGTPTGGVYSFLGMDNNSLDPSKLDPGNITITYTYTDGNNCSVSANNEIEIQDCTVTGLNTEHLQEIRFFPNPTTNRLTISFSSLSIDSHDKIIIMNALGQIILTSDPRIINEYILPESGIYFITITRGNETLETRRIIKY